MKEDYQEQEIKIKFESSSFSMSSYISARLPWLFKYIRFIPIGDIITVDYFLQHFRKKCNDYDLNKIWGYRITKYNVRFCYKCKKNKIKSLQQ